MQTGLFRMIGDDVLLNPQECFVSNGLLLVDSGFGFFYPMNNENLEVTPHAPSFQALTPEWRLGAKSQVLCDLPCEIA
jgi:hypothetical protein